jgi:hypothetical protein
VTEIQTIRNSADSSFVREIQTITTSATNSGTVTGSFSVRYGNSAGSVTIQATDNAGTVESKLESLSGITDVMVSLDAGVDGLADSIWTVEFLNPVGDVLALVVDGASLVGVNPVVTNVEYRKGISPLGGTFIVKYGEGVGSTTDNLDFDISAVDMKTALEKLTTIGTVNVGREDLGNGFRWTVSFLSNLGNLEMMAASKIRQEIQTVSTTGGDPNPLAVRSLLLLVVTLPLTWHTISPRVV